MGRRRVSPRIGFVPSTPGEPVWGLTARAARRVDEWEELDMLTAMSSGVLKEGSRQPIWDAPVWATPRVLPGGLATGELLAGGPLAPHEQQWLTELDALSSPSPRVMLNAWFLGKSGQALLGELLDSGAYRIDVPEEGALLVVAWLRGQGEESFARMLVETLAPFFHRLRFYPVPHPASVEDGFRVRLQTVKQLRDRLAEVRPRPELERQRESLLTWAPLYDRLVQLFVETRTAEGICQHFPPGWHERARRLRREIQATHRTPGIRWTHRPTSQFGRLFTALKRCLDHDVKLDAGQRRQLEHILDAIEGVRGLPTSERALALRRYQERLALRPSNPAVAQVLLGRLRGQGPDAGLISLEQVAGPVTEEESRQYQLPAGSAIPPTLMRKLRRSEEDSLEHLVAKGLLNSSEAMARVLPQLTAHIQALGMPDAGARRLHGRLYAAFRQRRSLLLQGLDSQVRLQELPWVRILEDRRRSTPDTREAARQTLEQLTTLAVTAFPTSLLPDPLLQELRVLAQREGRALPLVDLLAADLFEGTFAPPFHEAAARASALLAGTLYARYYELPEPGPVPDGVTPEQHFTALCTERAREQGAPGSDVDASGRVLEQARILTTHNLAVLFQELGLGQSLALVLPELARRCFRWVLERLQLKTKWSSSRLRHVRHGAQAWRQMVFFLSFTSVAEQERFLNWAESTLAEERPDFIERFTPALVRLRARLHGGPERTEGRLFLGWTPEPHWLMPGNAGA